MAPPIDRPNGLRAVQTINGSSWIGGVRDYTVDALNAAAIFRGSPVTLEADGNVAAAAAGKGPPGNTHGAAAGHPT